MGRRDQAGFAKQVDLDTAAAAVAYAVPLDEFEAEIEREEIEDDGMYGSRAQVAVEFGTRHYPLTGSGSVRPASFGLHLSSVFGAPTSTRLDALFAATAPKIVGDVVRPSTPNGFVYEATVEGTTGASEPTWPTIAGGTVVSGTVTFRAVSLTGGIWRHLWGTENAPTPLSAWTKARDSGLNIRNLYTGAKGDQLTITAEVDEYVKYELEMLAKHHDEAPPPDIAMTVDMSRRFSSTAVTAEMSVAGGPLTPTKLREFELEYQNNLDDDDKALGAEEHEDFPLGDVEAEVTFTSKSDIEAHHRRAFKNDPERVRLLLRAVGAKIAGSHNTELGVDLKSLQTVEAPVPLDGGNTLKDVEVTARPVLDEDTGGFIEVYLVNTEDGSKY